MYKNDSTLNNPQFLTCHKTKPNQFQSNTNNNKNLKYSEISAKLTTCKYCKQAS